MGPLSNNRFKYIFYIFLRYWAESFVFHKSDIAWKICREKRSYKAYLRKLLSIVMKFNKLKWHEWHVA